MPPLRAQTASWHSRAYSAELTRGRGDKFTGPFDGAPSLVIFQMTPVSTNGCGSGVGDGGTAIAPISTTNIASPSRANLTPTNRFGPAVNTYSIRPSAGPSALSFA